MYGNYTPDPYSGAQPSWFAQGSAPAAHRQPEPWQGQQQRQQPQQQQGRGWQQQASQYQQQSQQYPQQTYPQQQQQQQQQQAYQPQQFQQQHYQRQQYQYTQPQQLTAAAPKSIPKSIAASPGRAAGRPHKRQRAEQQQQQQQARLPHAPRQQQQQLADEAGTWLDVLQQEVMQFMQEASPSEIEEAARKAQLSLLESAVHAALGSGLNVVLFGSARAGLALHSSDLDIMITGLCSPDADNGGYSKYGKQQCTRYLRAVEKQVYSRMNVRSSKLIAHARIPVLKLETRSGTELDVSINDAGGVSAANFLQSWQQDFVVLRPLVLVLKSILKQNSLGDVALGGLGSWSLANMVIAHLMAEDAAGGQVDHAGHMLFSFLKRFGVDWEINRQAVAVAQGGIVTRASLAEGLGPFAGPDKLAVKDPLTGREVAGGSHRYADVALLWRELYYDMKERGPAAAARAVAGQYKVLHVVLDCDRAVRRSGAQQSDSKGSRVYNNHGYDNSGYDKKWQGDGRKRSR